MPKTTTYQCVVCAARALAAPGDDNSVCAYKPGSAWEDNYNCGLLDQVRGLVYEGRLELPHGVHYQFCNEQKYATVKIDNVHVNEEPIGLTLWLTWYKSRGRTEQMWILSDWGIPRRPTEVELLAILTHYSKDLKAQSA
jgi:hypothetical protein